MTDEIERLRDERNEWITRYELLADELDRKQREWRDLDDLRRAEITSLRRRLRRGRHRRQRGRVSTGGRRDSNSTRGVSSLVLDNTSDQD